MKMYLLAVLALLSSPVYAQVNEQCPSYQSAKGIEILFSDESRKTYGFQRFMLKPSISKGATYEALAGKKGKVLDVQSTTHGKEFHEVLIEDCTTVYWYDPNEQLEPADALASGVTFIDAPTTTWEVSNKRIDKMTDAVSCNVMPKGETPVPLFFFHSVEGFSVAVVGGDFPGKPVTFRVDKNKAIAESESLTGANAKLLLSQIRAGGKTLLVSSYKWPKDYQQLKEYNLAGLMDALDKCKQMVSSP